MGPMSNPDRVVIFDTTLRDGEQSPGCSMNLSEKLEMARALRDQPAATKQNEAALDDLVALVGRCLLLPVGL